MRQLTERYLTSLTLDDLHKKMVFISGPRQVGKTTMAMDLAPRGSRYLNWDVEEDRHGLLQWP